MKMLFYGKLISFVAPIFLFGCLRPEHVSPNVVVIHPDRYKEAIIELTDPGSSHRYVMGMENDKWWERHYFQNGKLELYDKELFINGKYYGFIETNSTVKITFQPLAALVDGIIRVPSDLVTAPVKIERVAYTEIIRQEILFKISAKKYDVYEKSGAMGRALIIKTDASTIKVEKNKLFVNDRYQFECPPGSVIRITPAGAKLLVGSDNLEEQGQP